MTWRTIEGNYMSVIVFSENAHSRLLDFVASQRINVYSSATANW